MYFRSRICMAQNSCCEQMIERDVINAESCYQENGEEVRRQEAREEVRPQGRRQEGHAQGGGEESLREEVLCQKDDSEEVRWQKRRGQEVGRQEGDRQARACQAKEGSASADSWIVRHVAGRLIGLRVPAYRLIRRGCQRCSLA